MLRVLSMNTDVSSHSLVILPLSGRGYTTNVLNGNTVSSKVLHSDSN